MAIIGAGISGTYAAWRLRHSGRKIGIFEQWDRVGGRIHTYRLPGSPELHAELGAMYYMPQVLSPCPSNNHMGELVSSLNSTVVVQNNSSNFPSVNFRIAFSEGAPVHSIFELTIPSKLVEFIKLTSLSCWRNRDFDSIDGGRNLSVSVSWFLREICGTRFFRV